MTETTSLIFRIMRHKLDKSILYSMNNNPINWRGKIYINPKDPRIIVPMIAPYLGWTLNFGKPISYILITVFVLAILVSYLLTGKN
jgi:uncharacterized membrane protein